MQVFLHAIGTAVPEYAYRQDALRDLMKAQPHQERRTPLLIGRIYNQSGIEQRHGVLPDFLPGSSGGAFYDASTGQFKNPTTRTRNDTYTREARHLFERAARGALEATSFHAGDITHVITVSCTGFYAPGPDYHLVRALGLNPQVQRSHLGFMGCYAAFPALRTAQAFCLADPDAVVLVVSAEICSVHQRQGEDPDTLMANGVFADGAAAAVVSARPAPDSARTLTLDRFRTMLTPTGEEDMAWTVGDHGFEMVLSTYVPGIIEENIRDALLPLVEEAGLSLTEVRHWAVHPGGRSILDKVQGSLDLTEEQLVPSRGVLRDYGNMSSATVLFVLKEILEGPPGAQEEQVVGVAFGPGLTVEMALLGKPGIP